MTVPFNVNQKLSADNTAPAIGAAAITPHASTNFPDGPCRGVYVGVAGDVVVVFLNDATATFVGVPAGSILPVNAKRINAVSTTATTMLALY